MMRYLCAGSLLAVALLILSGCTQQSAQNTNKPKADGAKYLLAAAPEGAKGVIDARQHTKDKEEVVVVGRIGGGKDPWVDGKAAFTIVDEGVKACSEIEGDTCPTPWDFCCEADLPKKTILVKVVDDQGKLLPHDARTLLNVKELQTVVVRGTAERDAEGNVRILATGVFVKK